MGLGNGSLASIQLVIVSSIEVAFTKRGKIGQKITAVVFAAPPLPPSRWQPSHGLGGGARFVRGASGKAPRFVCSVEMGVLKDVREIHRW